jgi:ribosomal protein S18 acetylase RimI-like enzyme
LSAYIPLLEVLPKYQKYGIGQELTRQMLKKLNHLYMIDLLCDQNLQDFYAKLEMKSASGMIIRNYSKQSGKN